MLVSGNRKQSTSRLSYLEMRAYVAVALTIFTARLTDQEVVHIDARTLPGPTRKPIRDALRFNRERIKWTWRE